MKRVSGTWEVPVLYNVDLSDDADIFRYATEYTIQLWHDGWFMSAPGIAPPERQLDPHKWMASTAAKIRNILLLARAARLSTHGAYDYEHPYTVRWMDPFTGRWRVEDYVEDMLRYENLEIIDLDPEPINIDLRTNPIIVHLDLARTAQVEDTHMTVGHYWMQYLEEM